MSLIVDRLSFIVNRFARRSVSVGGLIVDRYTINDS